MRTLAQMGCRQERIRRVAVAMRACVGIGVRQVDGLLNQRFANTLFAG